MKSKFSIISGRKREKCTDLYKIVHKGIKRALNSINLNWYFMKHILKLLRGKDKFTPILKNTKSSHLFYVCILSQCLGDLNNTESFTGKQ